MLSVQGIYRHGKIELIEPPQDVREETYVIVTFLERGLIDLREHGIDAQQAAELRGTFAAFVEDWDSPEMSIYDDYDAVKAALKTRRCCFGVVSKFRLADC